MCNLYRMTKGRAEVAAWFDAADGSVGANFGEEIYPGYPALVVAEGQVRQMSWGFPLVLKGSKGQPLKPKPVNNTRADKLDGFFWRYSFAERRCLIPLTAWAEAEGPKGGKTRSWLSLPDGGLLAAAGVRRDSDEWGRCYSMVMTDPNRQTAEIHNRMPVILKAEEQDLWSRGSPQEAFTLCRPFQGDLAIDRTTAPWVSR